MNTDLERYGTGTLDQDGCSACGDTAVPARVLELTAAGAEIEDRLGNRARVAIDLVPGAAVGDVVLVHAGVAIGRAREVP